MTDLMQELEALGITLAEEGFPEAAKTVLDARDEIERLMSLLTKVG